MTQPQATKTLKRKLAKWISDEYRDLNGSHIEILDQPPTALEFSRLIHISRPVIIKGFEIPASQKWSNDYLAQEMGDRQISIAVTPTGRADAVTRGPDNKLFFIEPHVEQMTMGDLLAKLADQDSSSDIYYLQSQNGNLYSSDWFSQGYSPSEYEPLREDVPSEVPWCSEALDRSPDAVNLWIGDGRSATSIHNDPYENIYTVLKGEKRFTLLPPSDGWCLNEQLYPHARFVRPPLSKPFEIVPSQDMPPVRWTSIPDPSLPGALPADITPIQVRLRPGEALYLPAGWWHYVQQAKETTIAINWWYDMEMRGIHWAILNFMRNKEGLYVDDYEEQIEASVLTH
ncbi:Clavaminate synthase-like protein [Macrolepiota fuliginosa MF-IS2]|uniref:Clavaminate synthase-like protein n=1 Tax=Macrolepiota fuliginosa MF-IS2 TaxID=1400762 RepID=A0A9P5XLH2_9AGAR|nr:Clavaminate synthase-like protein [Macrolepiota fuliginosa MF-IS2]